MDLKLASLEETQQNQLVNELKRIQEGLREVCFVVLKEFFFC